MIRRFLMSMALLASAGAASAVAAPPFDPTGLKAMVAASEPLAIPDPIACRLLTWEPLGQDPPQGLRDRLYPLLSSGQTVTVRMVVILVDFLDRPATGDLLDVDAIRNRLFEIGHLPNGSMADYYAENSNGRLHLTGEVRGWYHMPERYANYVNSMAGLGFFPYNSQGMVRDAVRLADPNINYAMFDNDGADRVPDTGDDDRRVDLLLVLHSGGGFEGSSSANELRSIAWILPESQYVDGVNVTEFAIAPARGALGILAHETGHLFGLPDLYDLSGNSFGLGAWSIMAGGWTLGEANRPAQFDAWSKSYLGFIDPVPVSGVLEDQVIAPVENGGTVYRIAGQQASPYQYFLVENRQRLGYDGELPGAGLLIYHVDELRPTNNIRAHYKVALEQADGLFQLENFFGGPSFGDEGDPWTAASPSEGFGRYTVPDSRNYEGQETGVAVYRISGPDANLNMTATLRNTLGPTLTLDSIALEPAEGDGDRFFEPGETFAIRPTVTVDRGSVTQVTFGATATDSRVSFEIPSLDLGSLAPGIHVLPPIMARVTGELPSNPYPLPIHLRVGYREEVPALRSILAAAGDQEGIDADFSNGPGGFDSRVIRLDRVNPWRYVLSAPITGSRAWNAGMEGGGYPDDANAGLVTPTILIPPGGRLKFDQILDFPTSDTMSVTAGAFVEMSLDGGEWEEITPVGGYDRRYFADDPELSGRYIFTRQQPEWTPAEFDLGGRVGGARFRFRFFSMMLKSTGLGWWIDNVRVDDVVPVRLLRFDAAREGSGVRLTWALDPGDLPTSVVVSRDADAGEPLRLATLAGAATGSFLDPGAPEGALVYHLTAVTRTGEVVDLGRIDVAGAPAIGEALRLSVSANPARGPVTIHVTRPGVGTLRIDLFDPLGRRVRRLLDEEGTSGDRAVLWDGRDDAGRDTPAGLYFVRADNGAELRTLRLVRAR